MNSKLSTFNFARGLVYKQLLKEGYEEIEANKIGSVIEDRNSGRFYQLSRQGFKLAIPIWAGEKEFDPSNNPIVGFNVAGAFVSSVTAGFVEFGDQSSREYQNSKSAADIMQYASMIKSIGKLGILGGAAIYGMAKSGNAGIKLAETLTSIYKANPCGGGHGTCAIAAKETLKAFNKAGIEGEVLTLTDSGLKQGRGMLVAVINGVDTIISSTNYHEVVKVGDRFFDALTGANGATWDEYVKLFHKSHETYLTLTPK